MTAASPFWWLALPVLLLPIWWHRQKRRRTQAEPLATARFLPAAPPQQMRVWRWDDVPLLVLRCLLLVALIAWLAAVALPWRGDTVLVGRDVPAAWADQQAAQAGLSHAQRMPLAEDVLPWLQKHEHEWRKDAKLLVLAKQVAMPAQLPKLAHRVEIRLAPQAGGVAVERADRDTAAGATVPVAVVAPAEHKAAWSALFAAFDAAGNGKVRHAVTELDGSEAPPQASLIVWDRAAPPPAGWNAPLWWLPPAALPLAPGVDKAAVHTLHVNAMPLQVADSPRGRLWASDAWPPSDADGARALYETWHALHFAPEAWPLAAQTLPPQRPSPLAMPGTRPDGWLAYALLALFIAERLVTHVRRR
ncbi:hypothetical protein GCM10027277_57080 [Pseudoduganella ginsengisoli]|uniref:Aerotolerance regulator N-terminal domain-containing protein n=1 Tax=Pseudoduganella ginsengisoli TaxID=1462440 RepID=A0A6L6Q3I3_9BURK|nr:BatA domain-containing protein [Pseudoduganella ginsengisoli]MTW03622.1 hypothetical protein [Pseudoduganella ginsengisoli]